MSRRALAVALPGTLLLLLVSASAVSAECGIQPTHFPPQRFAFVATVSEVSDRVAPGLPDAANFDWHVTLDVERNYRESVPKHLEASGWDVGCNFTGVGNALAEGERLFIAAETLDVSDPRLILETVLIWRDIGGGRWEFYGDALQDGTLGYPIRAVRADTTDEILAAIRGLGTPDTSTDPPASGQPREFPLQLTFVAGFIVALGVLGRRARRDQSAAL